MALFNFSNDWETDKTGDELCEIFMKEGGRHKKKFRKKDKYKIKLTNAAISSSDQKSLITNETASNKSPTLRRHDNKSGNKILKSKKHVVRNIRKKIEGLNIKVNNEVDDKIPLGRSTDGENSELYISSEFHRKEKDKNKRSFKRKRTLSEPADENDSKPLLKKIRNIKKIKNTELINDSNFNSHKVKLKNKKKKVKKEIQNENISHQIGSMISNDNVSKIKKILKNVDIEHILHSTKHIKGTNKKLNEDKKKQLKTPYGDLSGEKPSVENRIDPIQLKKRKKQLEKLQSLLLQTQENKSSLLIKKEEPVLTLRQKMMRKLKAARFRFLNEQIYTTTSKETGKIFRSDPDAFKAYHEGYRQQVQKWPLNPLDRIIKSVNKMPKTHVIADFGCGEARLANSVEQKVYSFDLIAANEAVIACDMARVPLQDCSIDVVVFCLSLMGTNLKDYIKEANRVLKNGGLLKIAEVESRFEDIKTFTKDCEQFGFKKTWMDLSHNLFYFIDFRKESSLKAKKKLPSLILQPCLYKKR